MSDKYRITKQEKRAILEKYTYKPILSLPNGNNKDAKNILKLNSDDYYIYKLENLEKCNCKQIEFCINCNEKYFYEQELKILHEIIDYELELIYSIPYLAEEMSQKGSKRNKKSYKHPTTIPRKKRKEEKRYKAQHKEKKQIII